MLVSVCSRAFFSKRHANSAINRLFFIALLINWAYNIRRIRRNRRMRGSERLLKYVETVLIFRRHLPDWNPEEKHPRHIRSGMFWRMFRIVPRFKSQNVMLFYTWPFNPRPSFRDGLYFTGEKTWTDFLCIFCAPLFHQKNTENPFVLLCLSNERFHLVHSV